MKAKDGTNLIRDPEDWARDWGWISNRRAKNMAAELFDIAERITGALHGDEGGEIWAKQIRGVAKKLDKDAPAKRREQEASAGVER